MTNNPNKIGELPRCPSCRERIADESDHGDDCDMADADYAETASAATHRAKAMNREDVRGTER